MPLFSIPFRLMPGSWGLKGDAYLEAEAHYSLAGEVLDRRLAAIRASDEDSLRRANLAIDLKYGTIDKYDYDLALLGPDPTPRQLADLDHHHSRIDDYARALLDAEFDHPEGPGLDRAKLKIDLLHGKHTAYDHDRALAAIDQPEGTEREIAMFGVDLAHNKMSKHDHDKAVATLREEPWIGIIDQGFDPDQGVNGVFFEFDWNLFWIDYLRLNGYAGHTEEQIVELWFQDVCRATADATDKAQAQPQMLMPINGVRWSGINTLRS